MSIPVPLGKYRPAVRRGEVIYVSGMTPRANGVLVMTGRITAGHHLEKYREAAVQAAKNALAAARSLLKEGEKLEQVLSLTVFVASDNFYEQPKVADFVSEYLREKLGDGGIGSRAAVGVACLPGDAPLEVQLVVAAGK